MVVAPAYDVGALGCDYTKEDVTRRWENPSVWCERERGEAMKQTSVRHLMPFNEKMKKYFSEISRNIDAARIICDESGHNDMGLCANRDCPFAPSRGSGKQECALEGLIETMGER